MYYVIACRIGRLISEEVPRRGPRSQHRDNQQDEPPERGWGVSGPFTLLQNAEHAAGCALCAYNCVWSKVVGEQELTEIASGASAIVPLGLVLEARRILGIPLQPNEPIRRGRRLRPQEDLI